MPIRMNQEILGEMIGTTRSRVNFFMNKFRKLGLIKHNGKIEIQKALSVGMNLISAGNVGIAPVAGDKVP